MDVMKMKLFSYSAGYSPFAPTSIVPKSQEVLPEHPCPLTLSDFGQQEATVGD